MFKHFVSMVILILTITMLSVDYTSADSKPNLGRMMWSAFTCSIYAEMSGNISEQERLYKIGITAGRNFVDGVKNKTIKDTEATNTPMGVLMRMSGPSTDFVIGRIFEAATEYAYDKVVKEDVYGVPIYDPLKWADDELKVIRAKNKYHNSNCALIH